MMSIARMTHVFIVVAVMVFLKEMHDPQVRMQRSFKPSISSSSSVADQSLCGTFSLSDFCDEQKDYAHTQRHLLYGMLCEGRSERETLKGVIAVFFH